MVYFLSIQNSIININTLKIYNSFGIRTFDKNFEDLNAILKENYDEIGLLHLFWSKAKFDFIHNDTKNDEKIVEEVKVDAAAKDYQVQ